VKRAPLPHGWSFWEEYLIDPDDTYRVVMEGKNLDTLKVAEILENHGHQYHADHWRGVAELKEVADQAGKFAMEVIRSGAAENPAVLSALNALAIALQISNKKEEGK